MSCSESHLSYEEQLNKFIGRGMLVKNKTKALERLKHISYYKIKQFSTFFMDNNGNYKQNTSFEAVIQNFYFDKNLAQANTDIKSSRWKDKCDVPLASNSLHMRSTPSPNSFTKSYALRNWAIFGLREKCV